MKRMIGVMLAVALADGGSKWLAARLLGNNCVALGWFMELRVTHNTGMALGIFQENRLAALLLPAAVIVCGWLVLRRYRTTGFIQVAYGLILGGFLGNFGERVWRGAVLDMIYFPFLPWFVCNVADIAISAGVAMLAASLLLRPGDWQER